MEYEIVRRLGYIDGSVEIFALLQHKPAIPTEKESFWLAIVDQIPMSKEQLLSEEQEIVRDKYGYNNLPTSLLSVPYVKNGSDYYKVMAFLYIPIEQSTLDTFKINLLSTESLEKINSMNYVSNQQPLETVMRLFVYGDNREHNIPEYDEELGKE